MLVTPQQLQRLYEDGLPGAPISPVQKEYCFANGIVQPASFADHLVEVNPGAARRALLWRSRELFDPGAFGKESQTTGDCTSHGDRNARDTSRCVEIHIKRELEEYVVRGATEPTYGARGHSSQGMDPYRAAKFVTNFGFMIRKKYPNVVDLTTYNSNTGARWGRNGVPSAVKAICKEHPVGQYVTADDSDEAMALFFNGYACHSGQNIGFDNDASSEGIHRRKGSWNHDMATVGYDDTKEIWPVRVYFVVNSWGRWNNPWSKWVQDSQLQKILGPPIDGMIVCHHEIWERYFMEDALFYSDIEGFPAKQLPDYGTETFL
jgi:hypothetical protein